ncbi:glycosyltransferase family 4 protein [Acinetobacter soli]|uniref:glycosyltransferase family 4 protein n=1 Tax=Acinetobacter soli TaxID=487316 RepID=UPI003A8C0F2A
MKILIINTLYYPYKVGGAEVSVQLLAEGLVREGHNVRVLCLHEKDEKKIDIINNVEIHYLPLKNIFWPFDNKERSFFKKLLWHIIDYYNFSMKSIVNKEIESFKPHVVHTNNISGFSVSVWDVVKFHKIRLVHTARDYYLFHRHGNLFEKGKILSSDNLLVKIRSKLKVKHTKKVDFFVGISKFIQDFHIENNMFKTKKSTFIYNSVNKINKNFINNDRKTIGFIGRLTEDKGFNIFCNIALNNSDKYDFCAAGNFSNHDKDRFKLMADRSNVKILGFITFKEFIDKVDCVILPVQWNEPFGRVVVESALAGINVYTNKIGGISELFKYFDNILEIGDDLKVENNFFSYDEVKVSVFTTKHVVKSYLKIYES